MPSRERSVTECLRLVAILSEADFRVESTPAWAFNCCLTLSTFRSTQSSTLLADYGGGSTAGPRLTEFRLPR